MKAQKVYDQTFTARNFNTNPLTISGLEGNLYDYELVYVVTEVSGNTNMELTLNSDTGPNYRRYRMRGKASAADAAVGDTLTKVDRIAECTDPSRPSFGKMKLTGSSGDERFMSLFYSSYDGSTVITPQSCFWKNTVDEVTSITLTVSNSVTSDAHIVLYRTPKEASQEKWELIETKSWTNSSSDQTFSGLDGDTDLQYKITLDEDTENIWLRINNDLGTNYTRQMLYNQNGTIASINTSGLNRILFEGSSSSITINAKTGVERLCQASSSNKGAARDQAEQAIWYSNTATNITSLVLTNLSSSTGTAKLYRKRNPNTIGETLPFEMVEEVAVSGDFSAGHTFNVTNSDDVLLYKLEWLGGSGAELRYQINSDTGSNYSNQYLSGFGGGASAGSGTNIYHRLIASGTSEQRYADSYIYPKSGENRPVLNREYYEQASIEGIFFYSQWWNNSADIISSIKVFGATTTSTTGTLKLSRIMI